MALNAKQKQKWDKLRRKDPEAAKAFRAGILGKQGDTGPKGQAGGAGQVSTFDQDLDLGGADLTSTKGILEGQFAANQQQAEQSDLINRGNQSNALGDRTFTYDENGRLVVTDSLSDEMQTRFDAEGNRERQLEGLRLQGLMGLGDQVGTPMQGFGDSRRAAEDQLYNRFDERMTPQFDRETERMEARLTNQGIAPGSAMWNKQFEQLSRQHEDARSQARTQATQFGQAEQAQGFNQQLQQRQLPFSEMQGLMGLSSGVSMPNFGAVGAIGMNPLDVSGVASGGLDRATQEAIARGNQGTSSGNAAMSAGTAGQRLAFDRERHGDDMALKLAQLHAQQNQPQQSSGGSSSSGWGPVAGAAAGALIKSVI